MSERPPRIDLAPGYSICRVVVGCWQLSAGHGGRFDRRATLEALLRLAEAGFDTFDGADIYTGVEELLGELVRDAATTSVPLSLRIHTKLVPDLEALPTLRRCDVEAIVDRSLVRLGVEVLDLVQFHWWNFDEAGWVEAALWLDDLRREGKIRHLGVTNFDTQQLAPIVEAGVPIVSNQVQYSLLDRRPEHKLAPFCAAHGIQLLAYGSLAGGFLSDRWLGAEDPGRDPGNRSLVKYRLIVEELGGWEAFQRLLRALRPIAERRGCGIAEVAMRWVLDRYQVAGILSGFSRSSTAERLVRVFPIALDDRGTREVGEALEGLGTLPGGVFGLERDRGGSHCEIMKTNLQHSEG